MPVCPDPAADYGTGRGDESARITWVSRYRYGVGMRSRVLTSPWNSTQSRVNGAPQPSHAQKSGCPELGADLGAITTSSPRLSGDPRSLHHVALPVSMDARACKLCDTEMLVRTSKQAAAPTKLHLVQVFRLSIREAGMAETRGETVVLWR